MHLNYKNKYTNSIIPLLEVEILYLETENSDISYIDFNNLPNLKVLILYHLVYTINKNKFKNVNFIIQFID